MKALREEAALWLIRLREAGDDHAVRQQHEQWLGQSVAHAQEFAAMSLLWSDFDHPARLAELAKGAKATAARSEQQRESRRRFIKRSAAGALAVLAIGATTWYGPFRGETQPHAHFALAARTGETVRQDLPDESRITLNAQSRVTVAYFADRREARLDAGDAIFEVTRDPARPFVVNTRSALITVVGTRFQVSQSSDGVRVAVLAGRVRIQPVVGDRVGERSVFAEPGDVIDVDATGQVRRLASNPRDVTAWERGMVIFDNASLDEIAATLSRYRAQPLSVERGAGHDKRITAVVQLANIEGFLNSLPAVADVRVERGNAGSRIVTR